MATKHDELTVRGRLAARQSGSIEIVIPETAYKLHLVCEEDVLGDIGDAVRGVVTAVALKIHVAAAGGRFISPMNGEPRIIAGHVLSMSTAEGTAVVQSIIPLEIRVEDSDFLSSLTVGELVNFHVRSGASWQPSD